MLVTIIILATIIFHLGVGIAIALRGQLLLAALVSAMIVALPLVCIATFGTPHELDAFIGVVATPLVAISFLVGLAGVVMAFVRWVRIGGHLGQHRRRLSEHKMGAESRTPERSKP